MKLNQRCHICLEDNKITISTKRCCEAYICNSCITDLFDNDFNKCPICKNDLEIGKSGCICTCSYSCECFDKNTFMNKVKVCCDYFVTVLFYLLVFYATGYFITACDENKFEPWNSLLNIFIGLLFYVLFILVCTCYVGCCTTNRF
jgi:hypothetical protein